MATTVDLVIIALVVVLPLLFFFRNSLPFIGGKPRQVASAVASKVADEGDERDFFDKMQRGVSFQQLESEAAG